MIFPAAVNSGYRLYDAITDSNKKHYVCFINFVSLIIDTLPILSTKEQGVIFIDIMRPRVINYGLCITNRKNVHKFMLDFKNAILNIDGTDIT